MSLEGVYDPQNIFARMMRGEIPYVAISEDAHHLAILDLFPQSRGHSLIIPKVSARNLLEFPSEQIAPLFTRVQIVAQAIQRALKPDGLIITQFNGEPAGQSVFHLHVHIIPRYVGQAMVGHGTGTKADPVTLATLAQAIRAQLV